MTANSSDETVLGQPYKGIVRTPTRPTWDEYFLAIADAVALRADCSRRKVGAIVVDSNRRIVASGYNGSPPSGRSCLAGQCPRGRSGVDPGSSYDTGAGSCIAVHAEANALLYAGVDKCRGSTLYVTDAPCQGCTRLIYAARIERVVYRHELGTASYGTMYMDRVS